MTARVATVVGSLSEAPAIRPGPSAESKARGRRITRTIAGPALAVASVKRISSGGWSRPLSIAWITAMQDACQHNHAETTVEARPRCATVIDWPCAAGPAPGAALLQ